MTSIAYSNHTIATAEDGALASSDILTELSDRDWLFMPTTVRDRRSP
jgi:hypothetical protein